MLVMPEPLPERRAAPAGSRSAKFWMAMGAGKSGLPLRSGAHPPAQRQKCRFNSSWKKAPKQQTNFPRTRRRFPQKSRSAAKFKTAHGTRGGEECEQCPQRKSELCVCLSLSLSVRGTARDVHEFGCRSLRLSGGVVDFPFPAGGVG